MMQKYITIPAAAAELGTSRVTLWRWIQEGRIPAERVGPRAWLIRGDTLETFRLLRKAKLEVAAK